MGLTHDIISVFKLRFMFLVPLLLLTKSFGSNALCLKLHEVRDRVIYLNNAACLAWTQEVAADRQGAPLIVASLMEPAGEFV